ncbi:Actin-binding protein IPP [Eumeta japonica]|uniref:Actin-binding protein IPP n=1 Tax=Eumeta variegata TaxID=151549 RepID=A0A4C1XEN2_EUMVA|nr:Actin-binding protein IPP [Eumeta japonica]
MNLVTVSRHKLTSQSHVTIVVAGLPSSPFPRRGRPSEPENVRRVEIGFVTPYNGVIQHDDGSSEPEKQRYTTVFRYELLQGKGLLLTKFREAGILCDVELVSGDTVVKAHRVVLSAVTPYFETMFTSGLEECENKSVFLPSIPPEVLPLIVDFIYTGQIVINNSTVQYLMDAADMLQLHELSASCAEYLKTQLHPTNVLGIFSFADAHNCMEVAEEALSYAQTHWKAVALGDEFLTIPLTLLIKLISSDQLKIDEENQILNAALSWLDHDPSSRRQHSVEVLRQVRLRALKPHALENALENVKDPSLAEIVRVFKTVLEMEVNVKPRQVAEYYLYVVGGHRRHSPTIIEKLATAVKFDVHKNWKLGTPIQMAVSLDHGAQPEPDFQTIRTIHLPLFNLPVCKQCLEGRSGFQHHRERGVISPASRSGKTYELSTLSIGIDGFKSITRESKEIAPMWISRSMLGVAALGGLLYAVGGENNDKALASGEVYDPITDKWTPIAPMQKARQCFGLAAVNKRLFAFGGIGDQLESSVEAYDPTTDEWVVVGEMPEPRSDMSVVTYGETVYVVGGRTQTHEYTSDVLKYTPARAEWCRLKPLLLARAAAAAVIVWPRLYVVGGQSTENTTATEMMDCYDLQTTVHPGTVLRNRQFGDLTFRRRLVPGLRAAPVANVKWLHCVVYFTVFTPANLLGGKIYKSRIGTRNLAPTRPHGCVRAGTALENSQLGDAPFRRRLVQVSGRASRDHLTELLFCSLPLLAADRVNTRIWALRTKALSLPNLFSIIS